MFSNISFSSQQQMSSVEPKQNVEQKQGFFTSLFRSVKRVFTKEESKELSAMKTIVNKPDVEIYSELNGASSTEIKKAYSGFASRACTLQDKRDLSTTEMLDNHLESDADIYDLSDVEIAQEHIKSAKKIREFEDVLRHGDSDIYTESEAKLPEMQEQSHQVERIRNHKCHRLHHVGDKDCS